MSLILAHVLRTPLRALAALAITSALVVGACGGDEPEQAAQPIVTQAAAAEAQQTAPIDAAQQDQAEAPPAVSEADSEAPAADEQQAQVEPTDQAQVQQGSAPTTDSPQQQSEQETVASDPNRDILLEGEQFASSIDPGDTERQFRFEAAAGAWLRIHVDGKGGMDPIATLLGPDGVEIAVNDDQSSTNRDSLIIAQVPTAGLQYIRVQPYDANSIGDFIIQVQNWTVGADDDNAVTTLGSSVDGRLNLPDDVDVFEFQLASDQQVFILVDGDLGVDVYAQVFDPDGDLLQVDDDGGHGLDAEMYFVANATGLWRVEVWPAANKEEQRQLLGAYRISIRAGLPTSAINEAVASDLAGVALTFLQALRDADTATILALAGPEALTIWGWDDAGDVGRDIQKIQSIDLGGEILQSIAYGDVLNSARGRVYFQMDETDWMRFELIQLAGRWLVDDWAHSMGPPS